MTPLKPLTGDRQSNETDNAVIACNDYLRLGTGRSLAKLCQTYTKPIPVKPPTKHIATLKDWSTKFNWVERAAAFDATWEQRKSEERQAVLDYGLALDYERVTKLKRLADFLEMQLYETNNDGVYHNVWVPDVKVVGRGDDAEVVDIERFNGAILHEYRAVLDDIAKEVGGRKKILQHNGKVEFELTFDGN